MNRDKLLKIKNLAEQGATAGERAAAQAFLDKYPDLESDDEPEIVTIILRYQTGWQRNLAATIIYHFGYRPYSIVKDGKKVKNVRADIPLYMGELIYDLYQHHRNILRKKMHSFAIGYASAAFPTDSKGAKIIKGDSAMADVGRKTGNENQHKLALEPGA